MTTGGLEKNRKRRCLQISTRGERHMWARYPDEDVELFRALVEGGMSQREAREKFGFSRGHASKLARYLSRR